MRWTTRIYRTIKLTFSVGLIALAAGLVAAQADAGVQQTAAAVDAPLLSTSSVINYPLTLSGQAVSATEVQLNWTVNASAPAEDPVQLAWFYKPPVNVSLPTLAQDYDTFILTRRDEVARDQLMSMGVDSIQYLHFTVVHDPCRQVFNDPGTACNCNRNAFGNNVAWNNDDICMLRDNHPDWFLRDQNGNFLYDANYGEVAMDPGNPEWRAFWLERARYSQEQLGWWGVFLDLADASIGRFNRRGIQISQYPNDRSYQDAIAGFLEYLYTGYFQPQGRPLYANVGELTDESVWYRYLQFLDGAMDEAWAAGWSDNAYLSPYYWQIELERAERTQALGREAILVVQGSRNNTARQQFTFASYLLIANGMASFRYTDAYNESWMYPNYTLALGQPLGPRYEQNGVWRRDFANGYVTVNPVNRTSSINMNPTSSAVTVPSVTDTLRLERSVDGGATFTALTDVPSTAAGHTDANLTPGGRYCYRISNPDVASSYTNIVCISTPDVPPEVVSLSLIDADSDQEISQLVDGMVIDLADLPSRNLNVRANTYPAVVGSVVFTLNDEVRIENIPAYALWGNTDEDYAAWTPQPGEYTLLAVPYNESGGQGTPGASVLVRFTVIDSNVPTATPAPSSSLSVVSFTLINSDTGEDIGPLEDGAELDLAALPTRNLNIRAETEGDGRGVVHLELNGVVISDNTVPFTVGGDNGDTYNAWTPVPGEYALHAISDMDESGPPEGGFLTQDRGPEASVNFTVVDSDEVTETATATVTFTPTFTNTPTATNTATPTQTPTNTATATATVTFTPTFTNTPTATNTPVPPTNTPVPPTNTATPEPTTPPEHQIVRFVLIDADTDEEVGSLEDGAVLNLAELPSRNLNVRIDTNPDPVGSVWMALNGASRVENVAPYALWGNTGDDYAAWSPEVGAYTLEAVAYDAARAGGQSGAMAAVSFEVIDEIPAPDGPAVVSFTLIDADADTEIGPLADGDVLNLADLPTRNLNIRADIGPDPVGSVRLSLNGASRVENGAPYALWGDNGGNYGAWTPSPGAYELEAMAYEQSRARGDEGSGLVISFAVIDATYHTLDVRTVGEGSVQVMPEREVYAAGAEVELIATAGDGWQFMGWSGGLNGTQTTRTVVIDSDMTVTATFEEPVVGPRPGTGSGLAGQYFDDMNFGGRSAVRLDSTVNFNWGRSAPHPQIGDETFSVRWTGWIEPLYSETYTIIVNSDDGVRVWIDGTLVVSDWDNHAARERSGAIALRAGQRHVIQIEYFDNQRNAVMQLLWRSSSQAREVVPASQLYPATVAANTVATAPTSTPVPPTATPIPPTATPLPPTATPVPPTATAAPGMPYMAGFVLINADTETDLGPLNEGAVLDLATLPTRNLNVRANVTPANAGSVSFLLNGAPLREWVENGAPFTLAGDQSGDYYSWTPEPGVYVLQATPYSGGSATGMTGVSLTVTFTVVDSASPDPLDEPTATPVPPTPTTPPATATLTPAGLPVSAAGLPYWQADGSWQAAGGGWQATGTGVSSTLLWDVPLDLRGTTYPVLAFRSQLAGSGYTARAEISFDKASWAPVYTANAADGTDVEVDLAAYSGTVIFLRWTWTPVSGGSDSWLVDTIVVREQPPATATAVPTSEPPTATPVPPTATPVPPTATPVPPTVTPEPPPAEPAEVTEEAAP